MFPDFQTMADANFSFDAFSNALHTVSLTAGERVPFGSITGDSQGGSPNKWYTTAALPGAVACAITSLATTGRFIYYCHFRGWKTMSTESLYDGILHVIGESSDWKASKEPHVVTSAKGAQFSSESGAVINLQMSSADAITLIVFATHL
jgi:hypothetical protein